MNGAALRCGESAELGDIGRTRGGFALIFALLLRRLRKDEQDSRQGTFGGGRPGVPDERCNHNGNCVLHRLRERGERPEDLLEFVKQRRRDSLVYRCGRSDHNQSCKDSPGCSFSPPSAGGLDRTAGALLNRTPIRQILALKPTSDSWRARRLVRWPRRVQGHPLQRRGLPVFLASCNQVALQPGCAGVL